MAIKVTNSFKPLHSFSCHIRSLSSQHLLQQSIITAIESKDYRQIPDLLSSSNESFRTSNPFSFLSNFHQDDKTKIINEVVQSFIPLRPHSRLQTTYSHLLSFTLQTTNPLPLSLAILQRTLRSGCSPVPQTHLLLSNAWLHQRNQSNQTISTILLQMRSIGYRPDTGVCNYLILSLCKVDRYEEGVELLRGMSGAGCVPDLESFGSAIGPLCDVRKTRYIEELIREMVCKFRLSPRKEMVVRVLKAMRANKDVREAVGMIKFLEEKDIEIGFESYEMVVEMCLESGLFVLAGKIVVRMTNRGFIPYIKVRQKLFEKLADSGELEFAHFLRKKFSELKS